MIQWLVFWVRNCSNTILKKQTQIKQPKTETKKNNPKQNTRAHWIVFFVCVGARQKA